MAAVSLRGAGGDELVGAGNAIGAGSTGSLQRAPGFPQSAENSLISHDTHIFRPSRGGPVETLVVYIFSSTDPGALRLPLHVSFLCFGFATNKTKFNVVK